MKIKSIRYLLGLSLLLTFVSCNKDSDDQQPPNNEISTHSEDQARVTAEMDAVANDANLAIETSAAFSGRLQEIQGPICDATIEVDVTGDPMTITIVYDGTACLGNRTRTGTIVLSMDAGTQWKNAGATVSIEYQNYKVTRLSDNKSITLNGTVAMENVSGGLLVNLASLTSITHRVSSSNLSLTFDNGSQRTWSVARQRLFTFASGINISVSGYETVGTQSNVAEWGTNRFGQEFTTSTIQPLIIRQDCDFRLTEGTIQHHTPNIAATVQFGLNSSGNPTGCPAGNYYFKLTWVGMGGDTVTVIRPY
jgi:hypothetical protein